MTTHHPQSKRVRFQERAFSIGNFVGVNGYRVNLAAFRRLMVEGGYVVEETGHFLPGLREGGPVVLVHWFAPEEIDSDLGRFFMQELKPRGIVTNPEQFGEAFAAVISSLFPREPERSWHLYSTNTLRRLAAPTGRTAAVDCDSPLEVFSTLYRRVRELLVGDTVLDAGCSSGFLPLVMAQERPELSRVLGVDIRPEPFPMARRIAAERGLTHVQFVRTDLLSDDVASLERFDTVTILHVLEHFTEADMYRVLDNLLPITTRRLIIAVPYETGEPEAVYGHEQLFTPAALEAVGQWCLTRWGAGEMQCEECAGGLLYLDRNAASRSVDVASQHDKGEAMYEQGRQQGQSEGGGDAQTIQQRGDDEEEDDEGE